jgi:transposase
MSGHSLQRKLEIVRAGLNGGIGPKALAKKYAINHSKIHQWMRLYRIHGCKGLAKKYGRYPASFKLKVLQRMRKDRLSFTETAAIFNIRGINAVARWDRLYREGGIEALEPGQKGGQRAVVDPKGKAAPKAANDRQSREELLAELSRLRMENAYLKKLDALVRARQAPRKRK